MTTTTTQRSLDVLLRTKLIFVSLSLSLFLSLSSLFRSSFFFKHTQRLEIAFWRFFLSLLFSLLFFLFRRFFLLSLSPGGEIPPRKSSRYKSRSTAEMLAPERNTKKSQLPSPPIGKQERRKVYPRKGYSITRKYKSNKPKFESIKNVSHKIYSQYILYMKFI